MKDISAQHTIAAARKSEAAPNRKPLWIGVAAFAVICLIAVAIGALKIFSNLSPSSTNTANTTETQSPASTDSVTTPTTAVVSSGPPSSDGMLKIPAGTYEVGTTPADQYHSATTTIDLSEFWVDKFQITNLQYQQYITATGNPTPAVWPGQDDHPVRGVEWDQAVAYCSWVNKRLLNEAEWEAAGRGSGSSPPLYPWGTDPTAGGKTFGMPDQDTYAVGSQSFNVSPFGVFDLVGNVWEWVAKPYSNVQEGDNVLRGGRFGLPQDLAYRLAVAPDDTRYVKFAGFRCAADQVK